MKHFPIYLLAAICIFAPSCKSRTSKADAQDKILVAYFSATGTTAAVAEKLSKSAGADLFEIAPDTLYTAEDLDWRNKQSRSSLEMMDQASRPVMRNALDSVSNYKTVFVGFPVWWGTAPRIINTFLETYDFSCKDVALFATSGSSSINQADSIFRADYPNINWKEAKLLNNSDEQSIKDFIEAVMGE